MPGRPSARSTRGSNATVARKSSTTTLKSRGSASARTSAHAVEIPDEGPVTSLRTRISQIFSDAQKTTATQRKLVVNLRKIQEACCYELPDPKTKANQDDDFDETEFNEEVVRCMIKVMAVKKSEPVGDRIIRFLGVFLKHATDKDNAILQTDDDDAAMVAFPETPTSRLTSHILVNLLEFVTVKDKTVRFRSSQTVAHIVNSLDQIDNELFNLIRLGLIKRLRDKEPSVRVQAVLGLGRLADDNEEDNDDEDSDEDIAGGILIKLLDIMRNDPSADVRRAVLLNLPIRPSTLQWLLERARDLDTATRRALYGKLLPALGDFRHMSISHRDKLLRWGLRDRDETVRKATARLFRERWIEDCASSPNSTEEKVPGQVAAPKLEAIVELLERIEVIHSGEEGGIAHEAMREFWDGRPDYREFVTFDDDFWNELTPESSFLARSLNDYCQNAQDDRVQEMLEAKMPEVTKFAYHIRTHLRHLITFIQEDATRDEPNEEAAEEAAEQEFVVEQLLYMALTLDYSDEMGRRQIYQIMREAIARPELPEECTKLAVDVLRTVCGKRGESEFYGTVLEAIAEVRDTILDEEGGPELDENGEESFHSAQSEVEESDETPPANPRGSKKSKQEDPETAEQKRVAAVLVYSKCLHIVQCMLQNLECDIDASESLKTMLNTLVIPAVRDSATMIRERGLINLGLCMLLSENLASGNLPLFFRCFAVGTELMKVTAIQTCADVAITHPSLLAPPPRDTNVTEDGTIAPPAVNPLVKNMTKVFLKALSSDVAAINLAACTAASKLLLHGILPATSTLPIIRAFTLAYFNPESALNSALRQSLSYFLPVFCHSKLKNAHLMAQVAVPAIKQLLLIREDIDAEEEEMVGWPVVCAHLSEWTDGRKVVGATELSLEGKMVSVKGAEDPHIHLAIEILERALTSTCSKDERKPLLTLLGKLHISTSTPVKGDMADEEALRTLHGLVTEAVENKLGVDATSRNMLTKLEVGLTKRLGEVELVTQIQDGEDEASAEIEEETPAPQDAATDAETEGDATEAQNTEVSDLEDATEMQPEAKAETRRQSKTPAPTSDVEMLDEDEEDDDDTMLAHLQAEGTRMPLDYEDTMDIDDEAEGDSTMTVGRTVKTESDIMDELLESELE
ncbi:condensin complex component cnd3 [Melanomma pulvis-pyrius CBS 109.77]|uniref:Condensin complex component cnd3 n=1 Tax=Melanomma pulvis-pyrius CBS 109.77 TaxID=1314802 RepID=A0A6A6X6K2_9PLEO|nr:condensin complex component cnd3 [Melanomma pulvis-pyrius CBS 109.77]